MRTQFQRRNVKEGVGLDKIILKWVINKWSGRHELSKSGLGLGHINEFFLGWGGGGVPYNAWISGQASEEGSGDAGGLFRMVIDVCCGCCSFSLSYSLGMVYCKSRNMQLWLNVRCVQLKGGNTNRQAQLNFHQFYFLPHVFGFIEKPSSGN